MRKTAAEGFKNFAADGICLQIVADAKYAGDRRRAPQEGGSPLGRSNAAQSLLHCGSRAKRKTARKARRYIRRMYRSAPFRSVGFCRSTSRSYHKSKKN